MAMWSERERKTGGVREGEREGVGERERERRVVNNYCQYIY